MPRYHLIEGKKIQFTPEEEIQRDAEEKAWKDDETNRWLGYLREKRNALLAKTDWTANSDVTMSDAMRTYRQQLRDITNQTPTDAELTNIVFPDEVTE